MALVHVLLRDACLHPRKELQNAKDSSGSNMLRSSSWPEKRLPRGSWHEEPLEISLATQHRATMALSCKCSLPHWGDAEARWSEGNACKGLGSLQAAQPRWLSDAWIQVQTSTEPLLNGRTSIMNVIFTLVFLFPIS